MKKTAYIFLALVVLLSGCGLAGNSPTSTPLPTLELPYFPKTGDTAFFDDFEVNDGLAWYLNKAETSETSVEGGRLKLSVSEKNWSVWTTTGNVDTPDIVIQVDTSSENEDETSTQGIICRFQDNDNFYSLSVARGGYVEIRKTVQGMQTLLFSQIVGKNMVRPKDNNLTATCIGDTLAIYANQYYLASAKDTDLASGDVGVIIGTTQGAGHEVFFDNFMAVIPN